MNLVKCKKCGTTVLTDSTLQDRLMAEKEDLLLEIEKLTHKERFLVGAKLKKVKSIKHTKIQKVGEICGLLKQLRHQVREGERVVHEVVAELFGLELKKLGLSREKLNEIRKQAEEIHQKRVATAQKEIERIYSSVDIKPHNDWHNANGVYDPTAKKAMDSR